MIGSCGACPAKDQTIELLKETIEDLRAQNLELRKTNLALTDARAYAQRFPTVHATTAATEPAKPPMTGGRARAMTPEQLARFRALGAPENVPMTPEQVERIFEAEQNVERQLQQGS